MSYLPSYSQRAPATACARLDRVVTCASLFVVSCVMWGRQLRRDPLAPAPVADVPAGEAPAAEAAAEDAPAAEGVALAPAPPAEPLPDWYDSEDDEARRSVFLVTFAAILATTAQAVAPPLRQLDGLTRACIRDAILDAIAHSKEAAGPRARGGRPRIWPLEAQKIVVFLELPTHFHVALKLSGDMRFLPLKQVLRTRSGLASHWSTSHAMYWSAVRYGAVPTARKLAVDEAPLTWTNDGVAMSLYDECQEPFMALVQKRRREAREMRPSADELQAGLERQKKAPRFSKLDFTALVIAEQLRTPGQVMAYSQQKGSAQVQAFVCKNQGRLKEYLQHAQDWADAPETAEDDSLVGWARVEHAARAPCPDGQCRWRQACHEFFFRNTRTIDSERLAACTVAVIKDGPAKTRRVPLLAGPTNAGKSTVFDPVDALFGDARVFHTPALGSAMPLANLALKDKRFLHLDDYRPVDYAASPARAPTVPVVTLLKLLGGQHFEVQVSQSFSNGNIDMRWTQGAVITAKADGLWRCAGAVTPEDVRHMQSRVEQFVASEQLPGDAIADIPPCAACFAAWLVRASTAFAARHGPVPAPSLALGPPWPLGHSVGGDDSAVVGGFKELISSSAIPPDACVVLLRDVIQCGAVHVRELLQGDWESLPSWQLLRPLQQRRLLSFASH